MATPAYVNGYQPYPLSDFSGGLNLRDKADAVEPSEAIDLLNVTFNERGAILQRDGFTDFTPADLTNRVDSMVAHYTAAGLRQLIVGAGSRLDALDANGAVLASALGYAGGPYSFAQFGDPTREFVYAGNGLDAAARWDGAAWTSGAALATVDGAGARQMPRAGALCVTASTPGSTSGTNASNRLVATAFGTLTNGGPGQAQTTPSRVYFSNAGQPEVWETDGSVSPVRARNYIDLTPGDGERIMAAVTWRELVFIFKETKFFVLWGEGVGADGTPTFQVREVVNSIGLASSQAVAVGRDGVYFFNRRGVYRTNGGDPVLLSDKLAPLWTGNPADYYLGEALNVAQIGLVRMTWMQEQLFVAIPTGIRTYNDRLLVYDTAHGWWTVYDIAASALAPFRRVDRMELHHGYALGPRRIGRRSLGSTDDRGAPITSRWRSGWFDYGSSQNKTLRETKAWGTGALNMGFSVDFELDQRAERGVDFSPHLSALPIDYTWLKQNYASYADLPAAYATYADMTAKSKSDHITSRLVRCATRGTLFSTQLRSSLDAPTWSVHRLVRHLREIREASIR